MIGLRHIDSPERGVILLDVNNRIISANRRASEIFGVKICDLIGSELPSAILHRSVNLEDVIEEVLEGTLCGTAIFHRYSAPVYSGDGTVVGRVEIYSDITKRRRLEEEIVDRNTELAALNAQLREAQEQLIHSERMRTLGEMAAGVAHDINNVLGIILGNVQLAKRKLNKDDDIARCIEAIELAAKDAAETVRRLKEIGRPVENEVFETVDLSAIVEDVIKAAIPAWKESHSKDIPQISVETKLEQGCLVKGNASELREAFANILLNAAHALEEKGGVIEVCTALKDNYADLSVKDTGVGMSDETKQRLFDPFFTTRGAEGTGLGMSMVEAIAIRHRGRVIVESEEGKGTIVTLRFPINNEKN